MKKLIFCVIAIVLGIIVLGVKLVVLPTIAHKERKEARVASCELRRQAQMHFSNGDFRKAFEKAKQAKDDRLNNDEVFFLTGKILLYQGKIRDGIVFITKTKGGIIKSRHEKVYRDFLNWTREKRKPLRQMDLDLMLAELQELHIEINRKTALAIANYAACFESKISRAHYEKLIEAAYDYDASLKEIFG